MRIGVTFPSSSNFPALIEEIVAYDAAGVDAIWLGESYGFDVMTSLGALSQRTSHATLGSGIIPVYSRTPALIAQSTMTLDALSGGRAMLGLGASGPAVIEGWHGVPYDVPIRRISETIDICRTIWRRERATGGRSYPFPINDRRALKLMVQPLRASIPIYIASLGPKSVELAASKADGWLAIMFWPERAAAIWGDALKSGAACRSSELGPLEIVAPVYLAIDDHIDGHRAKCRAHLAHYIGGMGPRGQNFYHDVLSRYGYAAAADKVADCFAGKDLVGAAAALPDDFVNGVSLIGSVDQVCERLRAFAYAGVTMLNVTLAGETIDERLEQLRRILAVVAGS